MMLQLQFTVRQMFTPEEMKRAPAGFKAVPWARKDGGPLDGMMYSLQVAPDDCTGCGICVDVCLTRSKTEVKHKAINMAPKLEHLEAGRIGSVVDDQVSV